MDPSGQKGWGSSDADLCDLVSAYILCVIMEEVFSMFDRVKDELPATIDRQIAIPLVTSGI